MPSDKFRQRNPKNKHTKFQLVFDDDSRNDFLTGFQKRKKARKKIALQEAEEKKKEGRRKERQERREALEEELKSIRLPEIVAHAPDDKEAVVYDHPEHTVTVTSVTRIDLEKEHGGIGGNEVDYENNASDSADEANGIEDNDEDENDDEDDVANDDNNSASDGSGIEDETQNDEESAKLKEAKSKKKAMCDKNRRLIKKQTMRRKKGSPAVFKKMKSMKRKTLGKFMKRGSGTKKTKH